MRPRAAAVLLVALGLAQMAGDLLQVAPLKGIAAATAASPAPKVFSAVRGLETYSTRFFIEWPGHRVEMTPEIYSRMRGPYNRRNVYGAALAYAPVLPAELRDPVTRRALCNGAPLLRELGVEPHAIRGTPAVVLEPISGAAGFSPPSGGLKAAAPPSLGDMQTRFEAPCR